MNFTGRKRRLSIDIGLWFPAVDDWKTVFYSKIVQVQRCFHNILRPDTIMEKCKTKMSQIWRSAKGKNKKSKFFKHHLNLEENLKRLFPPPVAACGFVTTTLPGLQEGEAQFMQKDIKAKEKSQKQELPEHLTEHIV